MTEQSVSIFDCENPDAIRLIGSFGVYQDGRARLRQFTSRSSADFVDPFLALFTKTLTTRSCRQIRMGRISCPTSRQVGGERGLLRGSCLKRDDPRQVLQSSGWLNHRVSGLDV